MHRLNPVAAGNLRRVLRHSGRNSHGLEAGGSVRNQMALGHDEAGPDASNPDALVPRHPREIVQAEGEVRRRCHGVWSSIHFVHLQIEQTNVRHEDEAPAL